jgi:hypothetical protein
MRAEAHPGEVGSEVDPDIEIGVGDGHRRGTDESVHDTPTEVVIAGRRVGVAGVKAVGPGAAAAGCIAIHVAVAAVAVADVQDEVDGPGDGIGSVIVRVSLGRRVGGVGVVVGGPGAAAPGRTVIHAAVAGVGAAVAGVQVGVVVVKARGVPFVGILVVAEAGAA